MLRSVALVTTEVSDKLSASLIRVTRIAELGTTLAVSCDCEERRLLRYKPQFVLHRRHITSPLQSPAS
jgi:hypothetical protein